MISRSDIDHQAALIETRAACTTAWQDLRELARRHDGLAEDPLYRVLDAALERLALPGVTSVARHRADIERRAIACREAYGDGSDLVGAAGRRA